MDKLKIKGSNLTMKAGDAPNTDDIESLVAWEPEGSYVMTFTKFKLTKEEHEKFLATGILYIGCMGAGMPPILPTVHDPIEEHGFAKCTDGEIKELLGK